MIASVFSYIPLSSNIPLLRGDYYDQSAMFKRRASGAGALPFGHTLFLFDERSMNVGLHIEESVAGVYCGA